MGVRGPRRGSLAFWHRKRASKLVPRVRAWNHVVKGLSGFAGYKAGMAHVVMVDDRDSPTKGQEITRPVTIVEVPPLFVYSIVAYEKTPLGLKCAGEACAPNAPKEFSRAHTLAKNPKKKLSDLQALGDKVSEVRLITFTQPGKTSVKKTPDVVEIAVGGPGNAALASAAELLGKNIPVKDVLQEGEYVDIIAVTKGKGWQGIVKRFGVALNIRKATKTRRHGGSIGAEKQAKVMYTAPRAGQMGFHRRTDRNKRILKISEDSKEATPSGGFANYGVPKTTYLVIDGSIPGPAKRIVRLRKTLFETKVKKPELKAIVL